MSDIESSMLRHGLIKVPVAENKTGDSLYRKVAKFLFIIGTEQAAAVLKQLTNEQIDKVIAELVTIRNIDKNDAQKILNEFTALYEKNKNSSGGVNIAKDMLSKAFGEQRMQEIIDKTVPENFPKPFDYLEGIDNEKLTVVLKNEMPSAKAIVLSQLPSKQAAQFINSLQNAEEKKQIILHLAKMNKIDSDVLRNVSEALHKKTIEANLNSTDIIDGKTVLANILKTMPYDSGCEILESIAKNNRFLAEEIQGKIFTLDDIINIPDISFQHFIAGLDNIKIVKLIYNKSLAVRKKILNNISKNRASEILTEEKFIPAIPKAEQDSVVKEFLYRLLEAEKNGHIILPRNKNDVLV